MPSEQVAYNQYQCIGNLGQDPEIRFFESGGCVVNFSLAVYRGKDKATGEAKPPVWVPCKAFGEIGQKIADMFRKGDRMQVNEARLDFEEWDDRSTGQRRKKLIFVVWKCEKVAKREPADNHNQYDDEPF